MRYWPVQEKETLRFLVTQNLTGQEIAHSLSSQFNRVYTRSAVNGQINRMGLRNGRPVGQHKRKPPPKIKALVVVKTHDPDELKVQMHPCTIFELKTGRCHYPLWPHQLRARPDFKFCGGRAVNGSPYCRAHEQVVYNRSSRLPSGPFVTRKVPLKPAKSTTL